MYGWHRSGTIDHGVAALTLRMACELGESVPALRAQSLSSLEPVRGLVVTPGPIPTPLPARVSTAHCPPTLPPTHLPDWFPLLLPLLVPFGWRPPQTGPLRHCGETSPSLFSSTVSSGQDFLRSRRDVTVSGVAQRERDRSSVGVGRVASLYPVTTVLLVGPARARGPRCGFLVTRCLGPRSAFRQGTCFVGGRRGCCK